MIDPLPLRGDIWRIDFNPTRGREQASVRPALVVSVDPFNHGPAGLVVVLPLTTRERRVPLHVEVNPPEGGLRQRSFIKCEAIRSVGAERLLDRWGSTSPQTLMLVERRLRLLLGL
jgi:mRNA interferase MazF